LEKLNKNKKGFATVNMIVGGMIGLFFLLVFAFIFIDKLTDDSLLTAGSYGANATDALEANFSAGVNEVAAQVPSIFSIAVFILIVVILFIAYGLARKYGLIGGNNQIG